MTFKCQYCNETISLDNPSEYFKYICKKHFDETPNPDPSIQFDARWDKSFYWTPIGYQLVSVEDTASIPDWAETDAGIRDVIQRAFPCWQSSEQHHYRAARWARVIYLAYRAQFTLSQIADEMGMAFTICDGCGFRCNAFLFAALHAPVAFFCGDAPTRKLTDVATIENIWRRVQRVAANTRADGAGRRVRQRHDQFGTSI